MLRERIIPILLIRDGALVKTRSFGNFDYVGDPINTAKIFNELEVDEVIILDISASKKGLLPDFELIKDLADECFMPLGYGGGVKNYEQMSKIYDLGVEKISINSSALTDPGLIEQASKLFGSQAVICSVDLAIGNQKYMVYDHVSSNKTSLDPLIWAREMSEKGAGEILFTFVDREGCWTGYDIQYIKYLTNNLSIPIIAHGGAKSYSDVYNLFEKTGVSAAGVGSLVIYQKEGMGVLINMTEDRYS